MTVLVQFYIRGNRNPAKGWPCYQEAKKIIANVNLQALTIIKSIDIVILFCYATLSHLSGFS